MASRNSIRIVALGLIVVAVGAGGYWLSRPEPTPPIVGVVRTTEVRIAPEVGGQLAAIKVHKGDTVRAGDVVAELSAIELTASVGQARAALGRGDCRPQQRLCRRARGAGRFAGGRDRQGEIAAGIRGAAAQPHRLPWRAAIPPRSRRSTRRKTTWRAHGPTSPRRKPTTTPQSPGRPERSAPSRTRRSRRRRPRSRCSSGGSTRPSCGRRPTASSA